MAGVKFLKIYNNLLTLPLFYATIILDGAPENRQSKVMWKPRVTESAGKQ